MQFVINNFEGGTTDATSPVIAFRGTALWLSHDSWSFFDEIDAEYRNAHRDLISNKSFLTWNVFTFLKNFVLVVGFFDRRFLNDRIKKKKTLSNFPIYKHIFLMINRIVIEYF